MSNTEGGESTDGDKRKRYETEDDTEGEKYVLTKSKKVNRTPVKTVINPKQMKEEAQKNEKKLDKILDMLQQLTSDVNQIKLDQRKSNKENLRKHVLSTSKHPGKCIYECKFCQTNNFETNFAKEFRTHLITKHPESFVSGREAATYVAGIYEACNDGTSVHQSADTDKERNSSEKAIIQRDEPLSQFQDTIPTTSGSTNNGMGSTILLTSVTTQDSTEPKIQDELFPMLIVSKDVICIENPSESWNIGGSYDVEESGSLVPFHSEGDSLFHEHFQ
ncbi:hypothetical protein FQA39_LY05869 [Lamprigera yunnana]|nr:hypothetical protein FQA39_LY05869 [Lamprigera yunnana]